MLGETTRSDHRTPEPNSGPCPPLVGMARMPCLKKRRDHTAGFRKLIPVPAPPSLVGMVRMPCLKKRGDHTAGFRNLIRVPAPLPCWHGTNAMLKNRRGHTVGFR